ncbi:type II secretion system GspH family protein [Acinetobacter ursingii]|nr:type II secretion system GspH family protein [Acinetobacter ursingii]MCU4370909.1 type II secretion system GspH family protein [Acinetobacter ursingii]
MRASYTRFNPHHSKQSFSSWVHPHTRSIASQPSCEALLLRSSVARFKPRHSKHSFSSCAAAKLCFANRCSGFTLIELMVVIVIIAILASLILLNISGVDQRKAMQAREFFILDLKKINKESVDQSRIFALLTHNATDVAPFSYELAEYHDLRAQTVIQEDKKWQPYSEFPVKVLPERVAFNIESVDQNYQNATQQDLINQQAPKLIWFGNGEVKPVRIQFYFEKNPVGDPIEVDHLGNINENQ